jgi:hypothetical protein
LARRSGLFLMISVRKLGVGKSNPRGLGFGKAYENYRLWIELLHE